MSTFFFVSIYSNIKHVESCTSSVKVGAKYELAPDHVESATSSVKVSAE